MSGAPSAGQTVPRGPRGLRKGLECGGPGRHLHPGVTDDFCSGGTKQGKSWFWSRGLQLVTHGGYLVWVPLWWPVIKDRGIRQQVNFMFF